MAAGMLAAMLVLAACGGSGDSDGVSAEGDGEPTAEPADTAPEGGDDGLTQLDVGYIPIVTAVAPIELGKSQGFFEEEGLEVEAHTAAGGAALVPALVSGQYDFVFSNNFSVLAGVAEGLDLRIVSAANHSGVAPEPIEEALVAFEDIDELSDLEGKRVGVNTLNNIVHLANLVAFGEADIDVDAVEFVEIPFPDMPAALREGRVAAIDVAEPFKTDILGDEGAHIVAEPFRAVEDNLVISSWVTTGDYVAESSDVIERFSRAMDRAREYANENPEEVEKMVIDVMGIDPEIVEEMVIAPMPTDQPPQSQLQTLAEYAVQFGFLDQSPDVARILELDG